MQFGCQLKCSTVLPGRDFRRSISVMFLWGQVTPPVAGHTLRGSFGFSEQSLHSVGSAGGWLKSIVVPLPRGDESEE